MNLTELKEQVNYLYIYCSNPDEMEVVITTRESSIGGRAKCSITNIYKGIDWEQKQIRIEPNEPLIRQEG